ncbi:hypothetical protein [Romboutsia lituseburensis]|uniref:DUF4878 domain-containing protein n=1 Tax=Romboutsia lituseburensis DSM 797 TaxID=1121325 RepID=A0A1G9T8G9_9FIRM|nr:hypothetical protein [Romboutsia lituseburensis]CEH36178.1 Prokaryotic membrane lipoprotein lipid attachment site profile [Romboutsia lituseburensis]SDM43948.1 hypothetical protein SAMN04515677_1128 [Romboutsia lituseburensis DSM 797]
MKRLLLMFLISILMVGCSNVSTEVKNSSKQTITSFFEAINSMEDYSSESELNKLKVYFTNDSSITDSLIEYLTTFESDRQNELVNYDFNISEFKKLNGMYKVKVEYDIVSKEDKSILDNSDMYVYLKDEDGKFKIETADCRG